MPLPRVLEPEVMDSDEEARDYDAMDHGAVNARFCEDLLALGPDLRRTLDVGTGTAQIPIELCKRAPEARVLAIDLAESMLRIGARNVERAALSGAITLALVDAKDLGGGTRPFSAVVSNSIIHHIPSPIHVLREMVRVLAPGGVLFVRDLLRPADDDAVSALVETYASDQSPRQRALFDASLRAALTLEEVRVLCDELGIAREAVQQTSDRHFTIAWRHPAPMDRAGARS
ncbi:class I SAM-dependent methyltransferase [Polyangium aurulentum]|uniref:class I SAM-dependent methyltransferase n=1 Tax=Polyangium aurulentum TaxID=2567896 RepID=UPI0010AEA0AD|nr:class I SAM-dependent methyltransferase [Polyangium aurulentum]UQA61534.1 class I SAM-dependent methyltransferase [Polyangium aurulentum]